MTNVPYEYMMLTEGETGCGCVEFSVPPSQLYYKSKNILR